MIENPQHFVQLAEKRHDKLEKKNEIKKFMELCRNNSEIQKNILDNAKKRKEWGRIEGAKNRALRKKALMTLSEEEKLKIKNFYNECPFGYHVDHIIPISRGGKHIYENLQYLPAKQNLSKHDRLCFNSIAKALVNDQMCVLSLQRKFKITREYAEEILKKYEEFKVDEASCRKTETKKKSEHKKRPKWKDVTRP